MKKEKEQAEISFTISYEQDNFDFPSLVGVMRGYFKNFDILSAELDNDKKRITITYPPSEKS